MTLQDLGAIGELVGGAAVIVSLLYLAVQIRHGLRGYQSNITQQITNHFSNIQLEIARDAELAEAWMKATSGVPLSDVERARMRHIVSSYMIGFENMFYQYRQGMLYEEAWWARRRIMGTTLTLPGAKEWWDDMGRHIHPPDFVAEVEQAYAEYGARRDARKTTGVQDGQR